MSYTMYIKLPCLYLAVFQCYKTVPFIGMIRTIVKSITNLIGADASSTILTFELISIAFAICLVLTRCTILHTITKLRTLNTSLILGAVKLWIFIRTLIPWTIEFVFTIQTIQMTIATLWCRQTKSWFTWTFPKTSKTSSCRKKKNYLTENITRKNSRKISRKNFTKKFTK